MEIFFIITAIILAIITVIIAIEIRVRKPFEILIVEKKGKILASRTFFYIKSRTLPLKLSEFAFEFNLQAYARNKIPIRAHFAGALEVDEKNIENLIKAGGWNKNAIVAAAEKLLNVAKSNALCQIENTPVNNLRSDILASYLRDKVYTEFFGLKWVYVACLDYEIEDEKINEILRKEEISTLSEKSEEAVEKSKLSIEKIKHQIEQEIIKIKEDALVKKQELKKLETSLDQELKKAQAEFEARVQKLKLEIEKEELQLLKQNPELLLLSPQAARLLEASQSLKNARTVVNLSQGEIAKGVDVSGALNELIYSILKKETESEKN